MSLPGYLCRVLDSGRTKLKIGNGSVAQSYSLGQQDVGESPKDDRVPTS